MPHFRRTANVAKKAVALVKKSVCLTVMYASAINCVALPRILLRINTCIIIFKVPCFSLLFAIQ